MAFKKAEKKQSRLRCALFGPSGSGKTFTALRIATGMAQAINSKIAVIDTEHGSASLYADRFEFDVNDLSNQTLAGYMEAMTEAARAGYQVLIIDSLSHGWQELLIEVDKLAKGKYKGNSFQAWSEGTPMQKNFVRALLEYPGHIIATMRSKTEWLVEKDEKTGKSAPKRVGLAPEEGKGIEYEFSLLLEMTPDHFCTAIKDRTGKYQDRVIEKPGEDFGTELISWLNEGAAPENGNGYRSLLREIGTMLFEISGKDKKRAEAELRNYTKDEIFHPAGIGNLEELTKEQAEEILPAIREAHRKFREAGNGNG